MSEPTKAVFLSYASQDAEAAKRIADALRAAGVEVWFDQSELVGGDAWDAKIKQQIRECALFVPIITPNTNARTEGYFRREWKQAVERTQDMADDVPFLFPIVIGDVTDATARVPDKFREVQWTRLRLDETPGELAGRVARLLAAGPLEAAPPRVGAHLPKTRGRWQWWMIYPVIGTIMGLMFAALPLWRTIKGPPPKRQAQVPVAPQLSEARQLAEKARAMSLNKYNSTADDYATAEGLLKRALELEQNDAEIWTISSLFNTSIRTRGFDHAPVRREMARRDAERAVKLAPDSASALFALGRTQRDTDVAAAEITFKKILERDPNNSDAMSQLAWIYDTLGRVEEAAALYDRVLVLDPGSAALTRYVQFLLFFHYGRFAEAEHSIRQSVALQPSANSTAGLAMLLLTWKGDAEEAGRVLATAPDSLRNEPRMVWVTALVQLARRDSGEILRSVQRLQTDYIQDNWFAGPKAYFAGWAHALAGRNEAARVAWESALSIVDARLKTFPENQELHLLRGQLLAWLGQAEEARREARTIEELRAGRPGRLWVYSPVLIHAALGDVDAALPLLEALLSWDRNENTGWPLTPALLRLDPRWDKLRGDPRFRKLCEEPVAVSPVSAAKANDKSVAVLAFANLSDDKGNEYFSDGISEELLNVLAKIPGLKVSARTSAFYFKGKEVPIPEIAKQLGVAYVVEGSVRKAGDKVRITAQLIKAADGFHVWSDTFTRDLKDIFAVQDEIAGLVAKNLQLKMGIAARPVALNTEAYQHLFQARYYNRQDNNEGWQRSVAECQAALAIDPDFALAAAEMARSYIQLARFGGIKAADGYRLARGPAEHAMAMDPNLAEAHNAIGWVQRTADWNWPGADASFRRAYELAPSNATMILDYAIIRGNQGYFDEARALAARALELDPMNASTRGHYALFLSWGDARLEEATTQLKRAMELSPAAVEWHTYLSRILVLQGRLDEAATVAELEPSERYRLVARGLVLAARGNRPGMERVIRELVEKFPDAMNFYIAEVYGQAGDNDRAFEWMERARQQRDTALCWIIGGPAMKTISMDPRWPELLRKLGHEVPAK